jgi:hypothetical protein
LKNYEPWSLIVTELFSATAPAAALRRVHIGTIEEFMMLTGKTFSSRGLRCMALLLCLGASTAANADHGIDAYVFMAGASDQELPAHAAKGKGYKVKTNPRAMDNFHVTFHLPDGRALVAERKRVVENARGRSWVGQFEGVTGGTVVMSRRKGVVTGIIDDGENLYELIPGRSGHSLLFQVDQSRLPPMAPPFLSADLDTSGAEATGPASTAAAGNVQDIMLVYTAAVVSSYGSVAITESALLDAVIATNQAYVDSQADIQLNVVHLAEVSYTETGDMGVTLSRLRTNNDSHMDEVHAWRDAYGADLVAMISMDTNYCGIAYIMSSDSSGFAPWAFSVTKKSCLSNSTLDHEIGHNQGICHNREETGCTTPAYTYGYGLCGPSFRTIMSYSSPCGTSRIRNFSNPNVFVSGQPTGIDHNVDPANSADGARTMNNTADTIAAFRQGATTPPQAPGGMNASAVSDVQIDLQWDDNSTDESGFELQRSGDGASWSALASVGANSTVYSDSGLAAGTIYYYRVRAYNGGGSSGWSNTDNAETLPPPPPPQTPSPLTATPMSGERIELVWADVANESGYRLERSTDGVSYGLVASPAADQNSYGDTGLSAATTYYYRVTAFNAGGDSPSASASADTMSFIDYTAVAASTTYGTVTGSYADTASNDGAAERIAETESGGKKSRRHSRMQHRWQFNIGSGNSAVLVANAWKSGSVEDNFSFEYSTDGSSYNPLFIVSSMDSANQQMAMLAGGVSGTVYVRATDTDRTAGNRNVEQLHVDHLYIQVESGSVGNPPVAPANLNAVALSAGQVDLSWTDMSDEEFSFDIERSTDGSSWQVIATAAVNSTAYSDGTVVGDQLYYYRISAGNAAGSSAWDGPVTVQTPVGVGVVLVANGYKVKGTKHVDLSWTGGAAQSWDIYRQGTVIHTVPAGGLDTYTDNIGTKGGGSYSYQMCEAGGMSNCSNQVTVVF